MTIQKFRWSKVYESSEEELVSLLHAKNVEAQRHALHATDLPMTFELSGPKRLWCAEGSLTIGYSATTLSLQTGDAIKALAPTSITVRPGIAGTAFYLSD